MVADEICRSIPKAFGSRRQRRRMANAGKLVVTPARAEAVKAGLMRMLCSATWVDCQFAAMADATGRSILVAITPAEGPPLAQQPQCVSCGRHTPPTCLGSRGLCVDCACAARPRAQSAWGASPMAVLMDQLRPAGFEFGS